MNREARSVLIVDDAQTIREVIKVYLMGHGFEFRTARNGREALAAARARRPDLVIADVAMPEMNGLELCRALRQDPSLAAIPVLLVSSRTTPADLEAGRAAGALRYLRKPIDSDDLLNAVQRALAQP